MNNCMSIDISSESLSINWNNLNMITGHGAGPESDEMVSHT